MATNLKVGIFGGGVVGGGVYELVQRCITNGRFEQVGASIEVVKICVRSLDKPRDFTIKGCTELVTDYNVILGDPSINCIVELMGGVTRYLCIPTSQNHPPRSASVSQRFKILIS